MADTLIDDRPGPGSEGSGAPGDDEGDASTPTGSAGQPGRIRRSLGRVHRHAGRGLDHPVRRRLLRRLRVRAAGTVQGAGRQHPGRWRHGGPRVGPGLPARPPAAVGSAERLDARLVRRVPRLHLLHGDPVAGDRRAQLRHPLRHRLQAGGHQRGALAAGGRLGVRPAQPAARSRRRRCWRWPPPRSCSTGRSRSTAATSPRPWRGSSPSPSRSPSPCSTSACWPAAWRPAGTGPGPRCCWR